MANDPDSPEALLQEADNDSPEGLLAAAQQPAPTRSMGESFLARTVGRLPGALDRALGGLPSTAAGVAGAYSADDEAGVSRALEEGGGTGNRLLNVLLGAAELGLTSRFPGSAATGGAVGALGEKVGGNVESGDLAETGLGLAQTGTALVRGGIRGARHLLGGRSAQEMVTEGLGAERTAQEVGRELQTPGGRPSYAQEAITRTADEARQGYQAAQEAARTAGSTASPKSILSAAREASREARRLGRPLSGGVNRVVKNIVRLGRGQKSKILGPSGQVATRGTRNIPVDELIDHQSSLRREINKLAKDDPTRRPLIELSRHIDDAMAAATEGTEVGSRLQRASQTYRDVTIPTRKTAARVTAAETPEQAARMATSPKTPSRFQRFERAVPESAEALRSAGFNDMVQGSMKGEKLDVMKLADKLDIAEGSGQLQNLANTPNRQRTVRAIRRVAAAQRTAQKAPIAGGGIGYTAGIGGIALGWLTGRAVQVALTSERASRALLRLATARQGTPGWQAAHRALQRAIEAAGPAARAGVAVAGDKEEK